MTEALYGTPDVVVPESAPQQQYTGWLVQPNIFKRAAAVLGHGALAYLLVVLPIAVISVVGLTQLADNAEAAPTAEDIACGYYDDDVSVNAYEACIYNAS